ncbi:MAG: helix-turn-helix domain-containing protein [Epsilonproteobacteria bacterium]|nr:helix-turn-helix domain-containing protein [Campylobacterota bacterium]
MKGNILYHEGKEIYLPRQQTLLLELLVMRKNSVLSSIDIFSHVYHDEFEYNSGIVRNLVFKLRKIFPSEMIKNIYGGGYMLCIDSQ